ncbi:MAG: SusC/RagA family TonB-linked outer membrane protein [Bacteroidota bacterium]
MNSKFTFIKTLLTVMGVLLITVLQAQTGKITGKVFSEKDQTTIPGVTVVVKGKSTGVQTTMNGEFSISAAKGDVLVFTSIGYLPKEVIVGNSNVIQVSLKDDSKSLNEVVVVGYGEQSRRSVTGAITKLDTKVLETAPRANIGTALQGTIAGLSVTPSTGSPGASPTILLRGGASINSPLPPLVVVDGFIRAYNDIPSEDVASIDVLKDASATAVYGARANNGVILITTKKGKIGSSELSYKFTEGYNKQRDNYQYLNARDYIYYARLGNTNSGRTLTAINASRGYGLLTDAANLNSFDIQAETSANIGLLQQGWQDMDDPANPGNKIIFKDHSQDIKNLVFRNTHTQDHYLSGMGGNEKGKYFTSLDYYKEDGTVIGSNYNRFSGNFNGSYKLKPNLELSTGTTLSTSSQLGALGGDVNALYRNQAIWPTFNPWLDADKTQPNPGNGVNDGNPLYWINKLQRSNEVDRITVSAALKWDITKELSFKVSGNGYLNQSINQSFQAATQTYANLLNGTFSSTARDAVQAYSRNFQQTYDATATYNKTFGKHNIGFQVLAEYYDNKALGFQIDGQNAATDNISTPNASVLFPVGSNTGSKSENRTISSFAKLNYDYDQRFILNAVLREDGVSQLGYQRRIGYFPGVSAGWNVHNESFFKNLGISKIVSSLKPRVSYGSTGNVSALGNYDVQGIYSLTTLYNGNGAFYDSTPTNFNLIWETSTAVNIGVDLGLFNDRISLLFDHYNRQNHDLLTSLQLPSYTGFGSLQTNLGTYQNTGYEFTVNANLINNPKGLRLDMGITASTVKNKVIKLPYNGNENNRIGGQQIYDPKSGQVIWVGGIQEGQPLGAMYGYKQLGIFKDAAQVAAVAGNRTDAVAGITGPNLPAGAGGHITLGDVNWLDVNGDNIIDSRDEVYLGSIYPTWIGGFNFNASYKGFSAYTRFEFNTGNTIYNDFIARTDGQYQGTFNMTTRLLNAWSPANTDTDVPKVYYADQVVGSKQNYTRGNNAGQVINGNNSSLYESGNYLACREITVSYDVPKTIMGYTKFLTRAKIYFSADNLFYIKKFSGAAPESTSGLYVGTYPTPKNFVLGIQASF